MPGCGAVFYAGGEQAWQRHVGRCARANMDRLRQEIDRTKIPMMEDFDPEVTRHMRKVVRPAMEREGRLEVLPHERAGLS